MNFLIKTLIFFIMPFVIKLEDNVEGNEDIKITQFISNYGYPVETHEVDTEDGYILTLFRIPRGRDNLENISNEYPVLLGHPLLVSAEIYVLLGPKKSLGFVLADNGYDVWLLNSRGVWHSRRHKNLHTNQKKYWQFSWNEMGVYDTPAVIDYILEVTSKPNLFYVGHSQGTTNLFVMGSERPEYNNKIKVMIALAPGARYKYVKNAILQIIAPHFKLLEALADYLRFYEIPPPPYLTAEQLRKLFKKMCLQSKHLTFICKFIVQTLSPIIDLAAVPTILSGVPCSFSVKQTLHYAQLIATGNFQQYDWGLKKNLKKYGSKVPPLYNVTNISFPVAIFWGASDELSVEKDIEFLRAELPNIIEVYRIPMDSFTHFDFVLGNNLQELMYDRILEIMEKYK